MRLQSFEEVKQLTKEMVQIPSINKERNEGCAVRIRLLHEAAVFSGASGIR